MQRDVVLHDPIAAGDSRVERAVGDIPRHLLRAQDPAAEFGVIDARDVGARADRDAPSGFAHQLDRLSLEAALGDSEFQYLVGRHLIPVAKIASALFALMSVAGSVFGRIDLALVNDFPLAFFEDAEKTRLVTFVASDAVAALLDREHERILVAIN